MRALIKQLRHLYWVWRYGPPHTWPTALKLKVMGQPPITPEQRAILVKVAMIYQDLQWLCPKFGKQPEDTYPWLLMRAFEQNTLQDQDIIDQAMAVINAPNPRRELLSLLRRAGDVMNFEWEAHQSWPKSVELLELWLKQRDPPQ